jgi:hypothetical protein
MKASWALALAILFACVDSGCGTAHQFWTTESAWRSRKWMYDGIACQSSFKAGFKAGYQFATCGGDSCQPPGPHHFWSAGGMTEEDQRKAQAWCDGFTHGTLAAQQDGAATASALDAQTALPPEGVPDVNYYANPNAFSPMGSSQSMGQFGPAQGAPDQFSQNQFAPGQFPTGQFGNAPFAPVNPGQFPSGQYWSDATPFATSTMPPAPIRSTLEPPSSPSSKVTFPPAAPPTEVPEPQATSNAAPPARMPSSIASPGVGSLRTMIGSELPRAPRPAALPDVGTTAAPSAANPMSNAVPPAPTMLPALKPPAQAQPVEAPDPFTSVSPRSSESVPATLPTPAIKSTPAPQWELPIIHD